jgi:hypothetical protein
MIAGHVDHEELALFLDLKLRSERENGGGGQTCAIRGSGACSQLSGGGDRKEGVYILFLTRRGGSLQDGNRGLGVGGGIVGRGASENLWDDALVIALLRSLSAPPPPPSLSPPLPSPENPEG